MAQTIVQAEVAETIQNNSDSCADLVGTNVRMLFKAVLKQAVEDALGRSNKNECSGAERAAARAFLTGKGKRNEEDLAFICDLAGVEVGYLKRKARELWKM